MIEDFRPRLRALGLNERQIDSMLASLASPIYVGQTCDSNRDDFVSEETLLRMGAIPCGSGSFEVRVKS